jgi:hypothetical protein
MRVGLSVEDNQLTRMRPDGGAVPFYRLDADCRWVVPYREFTPARWVICKEQQARYWIRIDMAFKSHHVTALHV